MEVFRQTKSRSVIRSSKLTLKEFFHDKQPTHSPRRHWRPNVSSVKPDLTNGLQDSVREQLESFYVALWEAIDDSATARRLERKFKDAVILLDQISAEREMAARTDEVTQLSAIAREDPNYLVPRSFLLDRLHRLDMLRIDALRQSTGEER